jgi:hypothetical protein
MSKTYIIYSFENLWPLFKNNFDIKNTIWKKLAYFSILLHVKNISRIFF